MTVLYYGAANVVQYLNWAILQDGADPEATEDDILVLPTSTPSCHDWSPTKEVTRYANIEHTGLAKWRSRVQYKVKYWSCELSDGIVDAYTEKFVSTPDEHSIDGTDILEEAGLGLGPVHGLGKLVGLGGLSKGLKDVDLIGALDVRWTHQATPEDRKKVETGCAPGCKNHTLKARIKVTGTAQWLPNIVWNPGFLTETVDGGSVLIDVSGYCCAQD